MSTKFLLLECEHCGAEHLVNLSNATYELIDDNLEAADDVDERYMTVDEMIEMDDDEEADLYVQNTNNVESYKRGTPMVPGQPSEDGNHIINKPVTGRGSGIRVETAMATTPPPGVRQKKRKTVMQPPGNATPFAAKKKKPSELTDADHSREGLEVYGDDASQDYVGMGGMEGHMDALMQQAYEADLSNRGF